MERNTDTPIVLGSRRELFVDSFMIGDLTGGAKPVLHKPELKEVVLSDDCPWESSTAYFAVLKDGDLSRMYYRGYHHGRGEQALGEPMCYAESADGLTWIKPDLGLFNFEGSPANNIVLGGDLQKFPATAKWTGYLGEDLRWRGDMVPFIDPRPDVPPHARYKALIRGARGLHQIAERRWDYGMFPFESPDGLNWTLLHDKPVITRGKFDSQNLAFWDPVFQRFVAFCRDTSGPEDQGFEGTDTEDVAVGLIRDVRVAFSDDFIHWTDPVFVRYHDRKRRQLYTNGVLPYERAPHILLGFPTEFHVEQSQTEPFLMSSRDGGVSFSRWEDALIPRDAPEERDGNRSNYMAHGMIRGNEREYFMYATEGYKDGPSRRLRRFTYRVDGFVSVRAGKEGGTLVTPPFIYDGDELYLNYRVSGGGSLKVAMERADGRPLPGVSLDDCRVMTGDEIDARVEWRSDKTPHYYRGYPVRLRVELKQADLYALRFGEPCQTV